MTNHLQDQNQNQHNHRRGADLRIPAIEKYAYCLCLHVKPTTIFIGVFKLIRSLLFASILLNTEITLNEQVNELGLTLDHRHKSTAIAVSILTRIITASVSAVGIYAVISGRAALLMPLYAILLVDFFSALPEFYNTDMDVPPNMSHFGTESYSPDGNRISFTRNTLAALGVIQVVVKVYFLCVVWKCYRYLRLIELVSPIRISEFYPHIHPNGGHFPIVRVLGSGDSPDLSLGHNMVPPPYESIASNMKPPNYEEAMKSSSINLINCPMSNQATTPANFSNNEACGPGSLTQVVTDATCSAGNSDEVNRDCRDEVACNSTNTASSVGQVSSREESKADRNDSQIKENISDNKTPESTPFETNNSSEVLSNADGPQVVIVPKSEINDTRDNH